MSQKFMILFGTMFALAIAVSGSLLYLAWNGNKSPATASISPPLPAAPAAPSVPVAVVPETTKVPEIPKKPKAVNTAIKESLENLPTKYEKHLPTQSPPRNLGASSNGTNASNNSNTKCSFSPPQPKNPKVETKESSVDPNLFQMGNIPPATAQTKIQDPVVKNLREQNDTFAFREADSRFMQAKNNYKEITTKADFDKYMMLSNLPVIIAFTAEGCRYCKALFPKLKQVALRLPKRMILNVDAEKSNDNEELHSRYQVQGVPTVIKMHKGKILGVYQGDRSVESLVDFAARAP
jgi:thioredoxin 1